jgi:hypothetical protein
MTLRGFIGFAAVLGTLVMIQGCGQGGPKMLDVKGTVKFEGKPIAEGDIAFLPENEAVGGEGAKIKDGKYSMKVKEGRNKVRITGSRVVPGKKGPMGEDWVEQFIPQKYNDTTTLTAEVSAGKTQHDFDLAK